MTKHNITAITFSGPMREDVRVPLEKAWAYFEEQNYQMHPLKAHTDECDDHWTWAHGYFTWDFTMQRHRLVQIGLGANGDTRIDNPSLDMHERPQPYYENGDWVRGIRNPRRPYKHDPATCNVCIYATKND